MAINLKKGDSFKLDARGYNLSAVTVGLGWDVRPSQTKGLLDRVFRRGDKGEFDLDAFAMMLGTEGCLKEGTDLIYFGNLRSKDGSIEHSGDNLTGEGEGDDERILLRIGSVPLAYKKIVFGVSIYDGKPRKQHFGMLSSAFVRAVDGDGKEMARFNLSDTEEYQGRTTMLMGQLVRDGGNWTFEALGKPLDVDGIKEVARAYV